MNVELERVTYRFRQPITTAYGTLTERDVLVLRLRDDDGNEGLGEAAPLPPYDGVTLEEAEDAIRAGSGQPQGVAALDIAQTDLNSRIEGRLLIAHCSTPYAAVCTARCSLAGNRSHSLA